MKRILFLLAMMPMFTFAQTSASLNNCWKKTGNSGTNSGTHFIGTTDTAKLIFRVNNVLAGSINHTGSTRLGYQAGLVNTATTFTAIGFQAGKANTTGILNLFIGPNAGLSNTTGGVNVAIGEDAVRKNVLRSNYIGIGVGALKEAIIGGSSIAIGSSCVAQATTVDGTIAIGPNSAYLQTSLTNNVFIGLSTGVADYALGKSNSSLSNNIAIGAFAFNSIGNNPAIAQIDNINLGYYAGSRNIGDDNIFIGSYSGSGTKTNDNIGIGKNTFSTNLTGNANLAMGWEAYKNANYVQSSISIGHNSNQTTIRSVGSTTLGVAAAGLKDSGDMNIFIGWHSGISNKKGNDNVFVGTHAAAFANNYIDSSTIVGSRTCYQTTYGSHLTTLGFGTLYSNTTGSRNTAIGEMAGYKATTANDVIYLGYKAGYNNNQSNRIIIGYNELPQFADAASAAAALPAASADGVYIYWNTTTNQLMVRP